MQKWINDHQHITMLLATKDVQSLRCIISVALHNGTSISTLLNQMQHAIDGKYSPRGSFSEWEYAIGFLAKALGGPRLLYALSKGDKYRGLYSPPRIPRQSARTGAESDGIRANFRGLRVSLRGLALCQFGTGTYVTELGLRVESEHFIRTPRKLGSD